MNAPREKFAGQATLTSDFCIANNPDSCGPTNNAAPGLAPLRIMTAGSVDDGKSTLIGRLMYDLNLMTDDVLDDLRAASRRNGRGELDLSLFTDGLIAEREQGITIDIAYRYFRHQDRPFILCDSPGHEQYTRNMVCAASQADIALIMIDARQGPTRQSSAPLAHCPMAARTGDIVFAINKMDLAGFSQAALQPKLSKVSSVCWARPPTRPRVTSSSFRLWPLTATTWFIATAMIPPRLGWYEGTDLA